MSNQKNITHREVRLSSTSPTVQPWLFSTSPALASGEVICICSHGGNVAKAWRKSGWRFAVSSSTASEWSGELRNGCEACFRVACSTVV